MLHHYEALRKAEDGERFEDFVAEAGTPVEAVLMIDTPNEWCILYRSRRALVAVHWSTALREEEEDEE